MPNVPEIQEIPDFLKGITIESPTETIENLENAKPIIDDKVGDLEELKKELEAEALKVNEDSEEDKSKVKPKDKEVIEKASDKEIEEVEYSFKPFIETMAEFNILDLEDGEEVEDSAEALVEKFESTIINRVQSGIDSYKESIPELGKQFLDFLEKGGDPKKFINVQASGLDYDNLDISDESTQKLVVKEYLKSQDYSNDEIKETIQDYEDGLLLEKQAKLALRKLEKLEESKAQLLVKQQEKEVEAIDNQVREYISGIQTFIKGSTEIAGLAINPKEKQDFEDYLLKQDRNGVTQYQKDIQSDPQKTQVELAFLKYKKYDFSKVAKRAESTAAQKIRNNILSKTETTVKGATAEIAQSSDITAFEKMFSKMRKS